MNTAKTDLSGLSQALTELVEKSVSGVVAVKAAPYRVVSGVCLSENTVAVAHHALRREGRVPVQKADGTEGVATVLGRDPGIDVAILKTDDLLHKPLEASQSDTLKAGSLATVVGLTIDAGPTASLGILGAVGGPRRTWRGGSLHQFLRLDVNLYPSQSGAAVVDAEGKLIGLATPGLLRHSAVAVPVPTLRALAEELEKQGRVRQGYIGVGLQPVAILPKLREKLGTAAETGLIVLTVEGDSPAEKAGMLIGDVLTKIGDNTVTQVEDVQHALRGDNVGRELKIQLLRGGEAVELNLTVAERAGKTR
ncbi:MAG: serine protease [Acidobacteriaceae bacterium]|nr:serine protease [Acidobacteriaceae bacterium]